MFQVIYKNYQDISVSSEITLSKEIYNALVLMFDPYAMFDMNCELKDNILIIQADDEDIYEELIRLYNKAEKIDSELMKNISIRLDV